ncbi:hypothetical protein BDZ97DRAFT_1665383 [Flammula alnicola]|nr:hypothetical protein BDZ97DRAFT_1665383 [Flammula alnicola]
MASSQSSNTSTPTLCRVVTAPERVTITSKSVFLAGSIDLGLAVDWQSSVTASLSHLPITILNPRRPEWNDEWKQEISFAPFREQVDWELDMQEAADVIAMYLGPDSKAPISLLELGLFARSGKMIVACPQGFWRKGNVDIVCARWGIEVVDSLEALVEAVQRKFKEIGVE